MYTIRSLTLLAALVLSLAGCDSPKPVPAVVAPTTAAAPDIPEAKFQDYQQIPEPEQVPLDSAEYEKRIAQWKRAWDTQNIDFYPYPPSMEVEWQSKYPYFDRLDCSFNEGRTAISCTFEAQDHEIDEVELISWLPYLSNRDALNPLLQCTSVCLNQDGILVGAVQPDMSKWRTSNPSRQHRFY